MTITLDYNEVHAILVKHIKNKLPGLKDAEISAHNINYDSSDWIITIKEKDSE